MSDHGVTNAEQLPEQGDGALVRWEQAPDALDLVEAKVTRPAAPRAIGFGAAVSAWFALASTSLIVILPLLACLWLLGAAAVGGVWALALKAPRDAGPVGYVVALMFFTGLMVWSVMARKAERLAQDDPEPMTLGHVSRSLLICFLVGGISGLLGAMMRVVASVESSAILGWLFQFNFIVGVSLIGWALLRFDMEVMGGWWRWCKRSPYMAGLSTAGGFGVLFALLLGVLGAAGALGGVAALIDNPEFVEEFKAAIREAKEEESRAVVVSWGERVPERRSLGGIRDALNMATGGAGSLSLSSYRAPASGPGRSADCMSVVWADNTFKNGVKMLQRNGLSGDDAHDLAMMTLIKVCAKYEGRGVAEVSRYFMGALKNNRCSLMRRRQIEQRYACSVLVPGDDCLDAAELIHMGRSLCSLDAQDKYLVEARAYGYSSKEVAKELDISEDAAKKRSQRALSELRVRLD